MNFVIFAYFASTLTLNAFYGSAQGGYSDSRNAVLHSTITLLKGEQRPVKIVGLDRFSISNHRILRAIPVSGILKKSLDSSALQRSKELVILKGENEGLSSILVTYVDGTVGSIPVVVLDNQFKDESKKTQLSINLLAALSILEECDVQLSDDLVVIRGSISKLSELRALESLKRAFESQIKDETIVERAARTERFNGLKTLIKSLNFESVRLEGSENAPYLTGRLSNESERDLLERTVFRDFPGTKFHITAPSDLEPTVYIKVYLVEMKKAQMSSFGLSWPSSVESIAQITPWKVTMPFQMDLTLQNLEMTGRLKILSQPELVVRAPGEAELFAGGEIPIRHKKKDRESMLSWKPYGLTLKLIVSKLFQSRLRLEVNSEVSSLDFAQEVDELPGIKSNRMKTQVDADWDQPLLLSGLLQNDVRESTKGLPLLSRIPVLGKLFSSSDYINELSELVAILVPSKHVPNRDIGAYDERLSKIAAELKNAFKSFDKENDALAGDSEARLLGYLNRRPLPITLGL